MEFQQGDIPNQFTKNYPKWPLNKRPKDYKVPLDVSNLHPETYRGVSKNNGTPKSSILIGISIINHPFWGTPIFENTHRSSGTTSDLCHLKRPSTFTLKKLWEKWRRPFNLSITSSCTYRKGVNLIFGWTNPNHALPETNSSPLKIGLPNRKVIF